MTTGLLGVLMYLINIQILLDARDGSIFYLESTFFFNQMFPEGIYGNLWQKFLKSNARFLYPFALAGSVPLY